MPRLLFTTGKDPIPIVQEAGWAPGPVGTGAENLAPTGIRSLDCPAHSQSLSRLSYPAHNANTYFSKKRRSVKKDLDKVVKMANRNIYDVNHNGMPIENTGFFISPSGISELDCATTKTDKAERSISIGRESLQVFFVLGALVYFQVPPLGGSREEKWRSQ